MEEVSAEDQKHQTTFTRTKLHDLSTFEVDPLENLIGFYSVVGKRRFLDDGEDSGPVGTNQILSSIQQNMGNVPKKNQMASAGSGSESAVMIKAIARGDNSTARGEGIHTEASCSSRLGTTT